MNFLARSLLSLVPTTACLAQAPTSPEAQGPEDGPPTESSPYASAKTLQFYVEGGYARQFDASFDTGGDFAVDRSFIEAGLRWGASRDVSVSFSAGFGYDAYDFDGSTGFAALRPWDDIRTLRLGAFVRYRINEKWTFFGGPSVRSAVETGVDFNDGMQFGLLTGASYKVSDRLTIGPGIGFFTQLEDSASVFPVLLIDWGITETLSLQTGRGLGATQGPGLQLVWSVSDDWKLSLGGRYENLRFRLDDDAGSIAPRGVGQERSIPLYLGANWTITDHVELGVFGGVNLAGELRLEDEDGAFVADSDYDPAPFVGLTFRARF